MGSTREHQNLLKAFGRDLPKVVPNARFFGRTVGKFLALRYMKDLMTNDCRVKDWRKYMVHVNKKGMFDGYILVKFPRFQIHLEVEAKTGKAVLSPPQIVWQRFINNFGGKCFILRDSDETIEEVKEYLDGLFTN